MHETMPVYCETFLNTTGAFPAEPVNAVTSFAPVIFGALALIVLVRQGHDGRVAYVLAVLTVLTGIGSVAWHALRTELTLVLDALPGLIYFAIILFYWATYLGSRYLGVILLAGLVALLAIVPQPASGVTLAAIVVVLTAIAGGLLVATWRRKRPAFPHALLMVGGAIVALAARTADLSLCSIIPVGTHFFWHIFLGAAAYAGVRMMVRLQAESAPARRPA